VLLRAESLDRAGLLDEGLFVLAEDVDLMFRLRLAGDDVHLLPSAKIAHKRGVSGGTTDPVAARRRKFWLQRNSLALALSYWPAHWLILSSPLLALRALHALLLGATVPGQRCWPLWSARWATRSRNRHAMRKLGLDRWFGFDPMAQ
jgi:GT2 family glycosyltransferase